MKKTLTLIMILLTASVSLRAQEASQETGPTFNEAADNIQQKLEQSIQELNRLREQIAEEEVPLTRKLNELERKLTDVRLKYQDTTRTLDSRTLDLNNLQNKIKAQKEQATYLSSLLNEYIVKFESRLHIAELQRYQAALEEAKAAPEKSSLSREEVYKAQAEILSVSLDRLFGTLGGTRFEGDAVGPSGLVEHGTFLMVGPAVAFESDDGGTVGTVEQKIGSLEPAVIPFGDPLDAEAAVAIINDGEGTFPLDPTLGNAQKIERTQESLLEHIQKGGVVMIPIFALAGAALLVAIYKWLALSFLSKPSESRLRALWDAVIRHDENGAREKVQAIGGPVGEMLRAGVDHLREPRDLIEEVMYEKVMTTRLKLQRYLPFIAICAAAAPLLGLLGTVTGIINTFKMITLFGSGDVKTLSGGISEALITTKFGLIVAIPSLLLHAFLSRKASGFINQMEKTAVTFINQVSKSPFQKSEPSIDNVFANLNADQLQSLLGNMGGQRSDRTLSRDSAGSLMNQRMVCLCRTATVAEAIDKIRSSGIGDDIDAVYVVDEQGSYVGHVLIRHLLTRPEHSPVESLTEPNSLFCRIDTHQEDVQNLFSKHDLVSIPVLDHENKVVGRVTRNGKTVNQ